MKKKLCTIVAATLLAAAIAGCGSTAQAPIETQQTIADETPAVEEAQADQVQEEAAPVVELPTHDRSGNEIVVPEDVNTIVSMAPSVTRVLIDMGLADKIIASDTNSQSSYGSELKDDVLYMDMMTPDQEQLVALNPDIIFTSGMSSKDGEDAFDSVRAAGVCVADIPSSSSIKAIEEDLIFIGQCVGKTEEAEKMVEDMETVVKEIADIAKTIPEDEKKTVLFELFTPSADYPTIYTAGPGTYINEMLELIGAENVAGDLDKKWPALEEEAAVGSNPDVILTADMYTPDVINVLLTMTGWENVTAIKNGDVYQLNADQVNQPNHHVIDALIDMAEAVYPDYYTDLDGYRMAA